ncbi:MAG: thymidine kinase [Parcubacteria group bacterium LiPW_41]|nr:MAG: thymidine kinase [Parcubacteria group bacterium LiPW_41]
MERGKFILILGNMFAGKTEELINRLVRSREYKHKIVCAFKPAKDTRSGTGLLKTAKDVTFPAIDILEGDAYEILKKIKLREWEIGRKLDVVGIDEVQFFSCNIYQVIDHLLNNGYDVIAAGLKLDFRGEPFPHSVSLLGLVETTYDLLLLTSCCKICGEEAQLPQRIIDGKPAKYSDAVELVGGAECYEARCHKHHELPEKPPTA